ncbi:iron-sulfur cluster repair di-iron protein [Heyndrickxia ginsengihumi]|uniref:Iron-sulfur cluster repair di-iron protein n=1 Tax=Heyndrickxia ginsengihumi TaxID=363870 RepID=A0A0A6XZ16_9BACI|nr:iron-sulfur cluster repair di-iron protein [Heyndrickxia ginsengihumi]KHD85347.1 ScdA [Heyndrickxia ginsengihumi]MBE6184247.1 iron-sulfur cluster repair di-iron protein [Bacillus sp. (in: firmicutes)]MCM3024378.1 iron-sulfur cluster repair di-iron protein [Heyndrickxia ginsengihumi]NEY21510.1 iron-sulfur cluster repair di-iron protein [Heyndrickxia ginsengihumi]
MELFNVEQTVGEVVTLFPQSADIFKKNRIDFCCGGNISVKDAAEKRGLSGEELLSTIADLYKQKEHRNDQNWNEASFTEIIDHIQQTHHQFLQEELPSLSPYVSKVMRVHGVKYPHLVELYHLFNQLKAEFLEHTEKEDSEQFPSIKQYDHEPTVEHYQEATKELTDLEHEHASVGDILKRIRVITNDYTLPEDACRTFQLVYKRLENLENDTFQHIHLENNILFKRLLEQAS